MKTYRIILAAAVTTALLAATSCQEDDTNVWSGGNASLTAGGVDRLDYDPLTWQMTASEDGTFTAFKEDASVWYKVTCENIPQNVGETVKASVSWVEKAGGSPQYQNGMNMKVKSMNRDSGMMTLISVTNKTSVTIHMVK